MARGTRQRERGEMKKLIMLPAATVLLVALDGILVYGERRLGLGKRDSAFEVVAACVWLWSKAR